MTTLKLPRTPLVTVTGKGGVGKTTVAVALARLMAERSRRVVICEVNPIPSLHAHLECGPLGHLPTRITPRIDAASFRVEDAVESYLVEALGARRIVHRVLANRAVHAFIMSAPAVAEFAYVNAVWDLARSGAYDRIVVDMPATGHAVYLYTVCRLIADVTRVGPLCRRAREIDEWLTDPARACVVPVTVAEELPVNETVELVQALRETARVRVPMVLVNGLPTAPADPETAALAPSLRFNGALGPLLRWLDFGVETHRASMAEVTRLRGAVPVPVACIEHDWKGADARARTYAVAKQLDALLEVDV